MLRIAAWLKETYVGTPKLPYMRYESVIAPDKARAGGE